MQIPVKIPAVWVYSTMPNWQSMRGGGYASFLSGAQQERLERIRQARLLADGNHRTYFLDERRSQADFQPMYAAEQKIQPYITMNLLGLSSLINADMLFGRAPLIQCDNEIQKGFLAKLIKRSKLHRLIYSCAMDCAYESEAIIEAIVWRGEVYLQQVPVDEIFPVGEIQPDGQFAQYDRLLVKDIGTKDCPINLLLKQSYFPGRIERHLYQLDKDGKLGKEIDLKFWNGASPAPAPATATVDDNNADAQAPERGTAIMTAQGMLAPPQYPLMAQDLEDNMLVPVQQTGIPYNTIVWIPNQFSRGRPVSDYDGAIPLQDILNAKETQIFRVLAKHADPKMAFPVEAADAQGNIRASNAAFFYVDPNRIPAYLRWAGAELQYALEDRNFQRDALLQQVEVSPILIGIRPGGGGAEAYKTVRVQAYTSVRKAARKSSFWTGGITQMICVAQALEQTIPGNRYDTGETQCELQDGLPVDEIDLANTVSVYRAAGTMSVHNALMLRLNGDATQVAAEEAELAKENAAKTPSVLFGAGGASGFGAAGNAGGSGEQPPAGEGAPGGKLQEAADDPETADNAAEADDEVAA